MSFEGAAWFYSWDMQSDTTTLLREQTPSPSLTIAVSQVLPATCHSQPAGPVRGFKLFADNARLKQMHTMSVGTLIMAYIPRSYPCPWPRRSDKLLFLLLILFQALPTGKVSLEAWVSMFQRQRHAYQHGSCSPTTCHSPPTCDEDSTEPRYRPLFEAQTCTASVCSLGKKHLPSATIDLRRLYMVYKPHVLATLKPNRTMQSFYKDDCPK